MTIKSITDGNVVMCIVDLYRCHENQGHGRIKTPAGKARVYASTPCLGLGQLGAKLYLTSPATHQ